MILDEPVSVGSSDAPPPPPLQVHKRKEVLVKVFSQIQCRIIFINNKYY